MTRDEVIRMASEAWALEFIPDSDVVKLERFAAFVAAAKEEYWKDQIAVEIHEAVLEEREKCAMAFEAEADTWVAWPQAGAAKRKGARAIRSLSGAQK